ncbi:phosphate ABC transporter substrate-binding protein PstS [Silanimonas sp.]|jgi:phosphate transport system substrate-binding protein|uniref:phosphate ABC transporter substrate-binding protein PstS n=1 Tax=Silanimonas sp. TaxID=1929290 RepID=UPI0037CCAEEF
MEIPVNLKTFSRIAAAGLIAASAFAAQAQNITGAGASFVFPVMSKWSSEYAAAGQGRVNYQSIGSGGGIAQAKAGTVDFGSTDAPLAPADLAQNKLAQFPSVIGGVVPVVNLRGIAAGQLRLTGPVIAEIYLGKITKWNDAKITALNPGVTLPDSNIRVVYRSDGSGTTYNFVHYLSQINPEWKQRVGFGTAVRWPTGFGGRGNEGVSAYVKQLQGSIGYVELSYATTNNLTYAAMQNAAGTWVQPSIASFRAAAASANWAGAEDFNLVITNAPGENSWPIAATNFILVSTAPRDPAKAAATLKYFEWAYANGDASAEALGYVPLPDPLVERVKAYWAAKLKR